MSDIQRSVQRSSRCSLLALPGLLALILAIPTPAQADPVTISEPVAPPLEGNGFGLCMASAVSSSPSADFGFLDQGNYNGSLNSFIEAHRDDRVESTLRTPFDLSNNNISGTQASLGDFRDATMDPACQAGGCGFFINDDTTSFGSRLRGYLNITADLANQPIHFGFYADDAVSLTFFDRSADIYQVMIRPPQLGIPTWRLTETVTFEQPGLYPLEILYVEIAEHSALEMSYLMGSFEDFERPSSQSPVIQLDEAGFTLFQPIQFFQTLSGSPAFADLDQCKQCDRQFVNRAGNNGCDGGYYCNDAALCAPCDTSLFCGPTCSPCGAATPFCINRNGDNTCVECLEDSDCRDGFQCDPATNTCNECNVDADCGRGEICVDRTCVTCDTSDACAGNSCNCCPTGPGGQPMQCTAVEPGGPPVCVECTSNEDCASGLCDLQAGHCVDVLFSNQRSDCCGEQCVTCPADYPFCLPGPIGTACAQCRWDTDCSEGNFCLSGQCLPCTRDRHCGPRCGSCGGDTPFCLDGQIPARSECVGCVDDSQCPGGTCNPETHQCDPVCTLSCAPDTYCLGDQCVECLADTQCPCGGTCDLSTNTCSSSCKNNSDCLGNQHCHWNDEGDARQCALGPMPSDVACGGTLATTCESRIGHRSAPPPWGLVLFSLSVLALWRRRSRSAHARRGAA